MYERTSFFCIWLCFEMSLAIVYDDLFLYLISLIWLFFNLTLDDYYNSSDN